MNSLLTQVSVVEICTLPNAEQHAFHDMVLRLRERADEYARDDAISRDLRRAAALLDLAECGLAVFSPSPSTGYALVDKAELGRLLRADLELAHCMELDGCGAARWNAALAEAAYARDPFFTMEALDMEPAMAAAADEEAPADEVSTPAEVMATQAAVLRRFPVDEHRAEARALVEQLHLASDRAGRHSAERGLARLLRDGAMRLDEYQSGLAIATPAPRSGWALVPATLPPKVGAAIEAMLEQMVTVSRLAWMDGIDEEWQTALTGGRTVLSALADGGQMNSPLPVEQLA